MSTAPITLDFARIVPINHLARRLLASSFAFCKEVDPFHLRFLVPLPEESKAAADEPVESSTEYESYQSEAEDVEFPLCAYAMLSFEDGYKPAFPQVGWRFGRGSSKLPERGVDVLLSKPAHNLSKSLATIHFSLMMSSQCGLMILVCGLSKGASLESHVNGTWKRLEPNQQRLMFQRNTMIRAGRCEYELQYTIDDDRREQFLSGRNRYIREYMNPRTDAFMSFSYIPGDDDVTLRGRYLQLKTQARGAFGWVSQGIDTTSGQLVAIKETNLVNRRDWIAVKNEVIIGRYFKEQDEGLLPLIDCACEHGFPEACNAYPEKYYIYLPLASADISKDFWHVSNIPRHTKLHLLEQPLRGLQKLHRVGIMHRDITRQNILILSTNPPRAALCDYGKAIKASSATETSLGPVHTLAPEVWNAAPYNQSIDVWAYGYAIVEAFGYRSAEDTKITPERHSRLLAKLSSHRSSNPEDEDIADLLGCMLSWDPRDRPTATEALEHPCWAPLFSQKTNPENMTSEEKHKKRRIPLPITDS